MLETIRVFATDELAAAGEEEKARHLHLLWAAGTAAELEARIDTERDEWRTDFEEVADDLRVALAATAAAPDAVAHRLARSLGSLTFARRSFVEARGHFKAAAARAGDAITGADDLHSAAHAAIAVSDGPTAFELLLAAADSAGAGNDRAVALASAVLVVHRFGTGFAADVPPARTASLFADAVAAADGSDPRVAALLAAARAWENGTEPADADPELARTAVDQARRSGDPVLVLGALDALGVAAANRGRMREAHRIATERLHILDGLPRHRRSLATERIDAHYVAAVHAVCAGDLPAALAVGERADEDGPIGDHPYLGLQDIQALALSGRFDEAVERARAMWDSWRRDESPLKEWMASHAVPAAMACGLRGDHEGLDLWMSRARELARVDDPARSRILAAFAAFVEARVAAHTGRFTDAAELVDRAFADFPRRWYENYARASGAELSVVAGLPDAADRVDQARPFAAQNDWAAACLLRASGRLHGDPGALIQAVTGFDRIGARFERACTLLLLPDRAAEGRTELRILGCPPPAG